VARQAKQIDLPSHKDEVRRLLSQAVRGGTIFFRGSAYTLAPGDGAGDAVRATLAQLLPSIYPRLAEVPQRVSNETTAVKAALSGNSSNPDLRALGVYKADGTLNESHPLLSALRGKLPLAGQAQQPVNANDLRSPFDRPLRLGRQRGQGGAGFITARVGLPADRQRPGVQRPQRPARGRSAQPGAVLPGAARRGGALRPGRGGAVAGARPTRRS